VLAIAYACSMRARKQRKNIPTLAAEVGVTPKTMRKLARATTWKGHMELASGTLAACGIDAIAPSAARLKIKRRLLSRRPFKYLDRRQARQIAKLAEGEA